MKLSEDQWKSARIILLLWLVTSALLVCSYIALHRKHFHLVADSIVIAPESKPLFIFSAGNCVGSVATTFEDAETINFIGTGTLSLKSGTLTQNLSFSYEFNFNLLRQLVGAVINVKSPLGEVRIGALEVNPIRVSGQLLRGEESFRLNQEVPGPLLLVDVPGGYSLRYEGGWKLSEFYLTEQPIFRSLELEVRDDRESAISCAQNIDSIDVTELTTLLGMFSQKVDSFLKL